VNDPPGFGVRQLSAAFFEVVGRWNLFSRFGVPEAKAPEGWRTPRRFMATAREWSATVGSAIAFCCFSATAAADEIFDARRASRFPNSSTL